MPDEQWKRMPQGIRRHYRQLIGGGGTWTLWPTTADLIALWNQARHSKAAVWKPAYRELQRLGLIADWVLFPEERERMPVQH